MNILDKIKKMEYVYIKKYMRTFKRKRSYIAYN